MQIHYLFAILHPVFHSERKGEYTKEIQVITNTIATMKIQLNTDKNIPGSEKFEMFVNEQINRSLKRFASKITRIEVHLSDQNAHKSGSDDIQCKIEARIKGIQPLIVTDKNITKEKALDAAIDKMKASLDTVIGKLKDK